MDLLEVLAKTPIFDGVPESDLKRLLPSVRSRSFDKGSYLFRQGDPGSHLYVLVSGKVKIEVVIAPDGRVKTTRVIGGHPLLVQTCQDALKEWKFVPASEETTQIVEFEFRGSN